jgi:ABC-type bacteriocin/lantibiotic exporter with double-glycine peptidase domain
MYAVNPALFQQKADHLCGAACVRMVLAYFGRKVPSERTLGRLLDAKFLTGIEPWRIELYLYEQGFKAAAIQEKSFSKLYRRWQAGWMPIVCWADWDGHYCIVTGIQMSDSAWSGGRLVMADPAASYDGRPHGFTETSVDRFKSLWYTPHTKNKHEVVYVRDVKPLE